MQEYERELQLEEKMLETLADESIGVICPLCQRCLLKSLCNSIVCQSCDFELPTNISLEMLKNILESTANQHSLHCKSVPGFAIIDDNKKSLYMVCSDCCDMVHLV